MRWSQSLIPTLRQTPAEAVVPSHQLMLRAGLVQQVAAGSYTYLPLGWRVLKKVIDIVRQEMDAADAVEVLMPTLQPIELWEQTGRREAYGDNLFVLKDRHGRLQALGPTHEEVVTDLVRRTVTSYRSLSITLYQIQTKFRDEFRPRFGVLRSREFQMKDAYSFDLTREGLDASYDKMFAAYHRIFKRCGLDFVTVEAESGPIGGSASHEFMVPSPTGEDTILVKNDNGTFRASRGIEIGHVFKLGTKYSDALDLSVTDENQQPRRVIMGCYGIGVNRIVASAVEMAAGHDAHGIVWPMTIAPYHLVITPIRYEGQTKETADRLAAELQARGVEVLLDDRDERPGTKFNDADLIGIPLRLTIGDKGLAKGEVELKRRTEKDAQPVSLPNAAENVAQQIHAALAR